MKGVVLLTAPRPPTPTFITLVFDLTEANLSLTLCPACVPAPALTLSIYFSQVKKWTLDQTGHIIYEPHMPAA